MRMWPAVHAATCALMVGALLGCSSGAKPGGSSVGKTYKPASNGKQGAGAKGTPPQSSAETVTGKPSAASDSGTASAARGQVVMNPGAPAAQKSSQTPQKQH